MERSAEARKVGFVGRSSVGVGAEQQNYDSDSRLTVTKELEVLLKPVREDLIGAEEKNAGAPSCLAVGDEGRPLEDRR